MVTENNYNEGVLTIKGIKIQKKNEHETNFTWLNTILPGIRNSMADYFINWPEKKEKSLILEQQITISHKLI